MKQPPNWHSHDLRVPLYEFMDMYGLTQAEMRIEGGSGRLQGQGVRGTGNSWSQIAFTESAIKRWLKTEMPPAVAAKVAAAGGLAALTAWRENYFDHVVIDPANPGTWTLPDGSTVRDIELNVADLERVFPGITKELRKDPK